MRPQAESPGESLTWLVRVLARFALEASVCLALLLLVGVVDFEFIDGPLSTFWGAVGVLIYVFGRM